MRTSWCRMSWVDMVVVRTSFLSNQSEMDLFSRMLTFDEFVAPNLHGPTSSSGFFFCPLTRVLT